MQLQHKIAFIGAGNMAACLIGGLVNGGYDPKTIIASNPSSEKLILLKNKFNINITNDNKEAARQADVIVFAVKPNKIATVCQELSSIVNKDKLIISLAAGIQTKQIHQWLEHSLPIIRCMPNTPALIGSGASALFANENVTRSQKQFAESLLRSVGLCIWIDSEDQIDTITALSGSGPAYFLYIFECFIQSAQKLGLDEADARVLILQTALGAARMAMESKEPIQELRKNVTSPGGTTERALIELEKNKLDQILFDALQAAKDRAKEMSEIFGSSYRKAIEEKE